MIANAKNNYNFEHKRTRNNCVGIIEMWGNHFNLRKKILQEISHKGEGPNKNCISVYNTETHYISFIPC